MLFKLYKDLNVRLLQTFDQVQVNIYNPQSEGHSLSFSVNFSDGQSLENVYDSLLSSGLLEEKYNKAIDIFESIAE